MCIGWLNGVRRWLFDKREQIGLLFCGTRTRPQRRLLRNSTCDGAFAAGRLFGTGWGSVAQSERAHRGPG